MLDELGTAIEAKDQATLLRFTRTLKSELRYFGAAPAIEIAERLERSAQNGDAQDTRKLFTLLQEQIDQIQSAMRLAADQKTH